MAQALREAEDAAARGEVPIGAVLVEAGSGAILAAVGNAVEAQADPSAHAEILAIRAAGAARGRPRLPDCDLYVTLEPCAMCAAAISFARIRRLIFAATDPKGGGVLHGPRFYEQPTCHWRPEVVVMDGAEAEASAASLKRFFAERRKAGKRSFAG